jgi:hypothetical protein
MIINLAVLALLIGLTLALNLVSLLPVFVVRFLVRIKIYRSGSLGYEKYEAIDSNNRTEMRSRYFYRDSENFKDTCTVKINLIIIILCVLICESIAFGLYFLVK